MTRPAVLQRQGGRRIKKVPKGERTQIGVIVGGNTKALLLKAMKESGRTISREVEHLIEKAHAYDDVLRRAMNPDARRDGAPQCGGGAAPSRLSDAASDHRRQGVEGMGRAGISGPRSAALCRGKRGSLSSTSRTGPTTDRPKAARSRTCRRCRLSWRKAIPSGCISSGRKRVGNGRRPRRQPVRENSSPSEGESK